MASDVLEYADISQEIKGAMNGGRLKLSKQGILFKNNKTGIVEQLHAANIKSGKWLRVARGYELKVFMKNGNIFRYDGFKDTDREPLADFLKKQYSIDMKDVELCMKGWNWGQAQFNGSELDFKIGSKSAFNIPLGNVSHTTTGKNEVILEFHQNDDADVSLMEVRFYIPPSENNEMTLEKFHEHVVAKADIIQATGDAITSLDQIPCLTPRGRYDLKIFPTFLQLHGKTFDYKIPYTTILRLFLLPHKDQRQMLFVVSLDPPIVQGQTRYHFLILSFSKEETISLDLNIAEEDLAEKYEGKLQKEMAGPIFEIVSRLMKALVARKITVPGSFKDSKSHQAITCSYKSNSGYLYPLERGFMFVHKPPIHVRFDEVLCVNFARGTGSSRYFDFEIERKNGDVFVFSSIEKDDYSPLFEFVSNKKLRVKNRGMKAKRTKDYDEIFDSDEDSTHDAYLEQMKAEGREKEYIPEDDSDSSSDEDFNPLESASDCAEEYDSNPSPTSGSDSEGSKSDAKDKDDNDAEGSGSETEKVKKKEQKVKTKKTKVKSDAPRKKKSKKNVDPNRPKRPSSGYMLWLNENRGELKKKYPSFGVADIAKKAGEQWNKMDEEKEVWKKKAQVLKEKYQEEMKEYNANKRDSSPEPTPKKKAKKSKEKKPSPSGSSVSPKKLGSFKSKEYISSEDSSSGGDADDKDSGSEGKKKSVSSGEEAGAASGEEAAASGEEAAASGEEAAASGEEAAASEEEPAASEEEPAASEEEAAASEEEAAASDDDKEMEVDKDEDEEDADGEDED